MKKVLAIFLCIAMLFACACQGGGNGKDSKYDILKPSDAADDMSIFDNTQGTMTLWRVTTDSISEANELLDLIIEYLASQGLTDEIKALYLLDAGIAGNYGSILPIKVLFKDENADPVFVPVYRDDIKYTKGMCCMGHFRDSEVQNGEFFNKIIEVSDTFDKKLKNDLGFLRDDVDIYFPIKMTRDLSFEMPDKAMTMLWGDTASTYTKFAVAMWSDQLDENSTKIDGVDYQRINNDNIKTLDDLKTFLASSFTEDESSNIYDAFPYLVSGESPVYKEYEGSLYIQPIGIGSDITLKGIEVKYVAKQEDLRLFMILEATRAVMDDDWNEVGESFEEYLIVFEKDNAGQWKCDHYVDIPFHMYESMF